MDEKIQSLLAKAEKAQRVYGQFVHFKTKAREKKAQMEPIVESIKDGMSKGQKIAKVLNDEVTREDVRYVINEAQDRIVRGFQRAHRATKKSRKKKR